MISRLNIQFPFKQQKVFWCGTEYVAAAGEYLLNHARSGIVMALRAALPEGGRVGVVAYNCHTVANAVEQAGCKPVFVDVTEDLHINEQHLATLQLDALVLTNLFGIHNDITAVQQVIGAATIIVDNAHGYGLPVEGDFTVYSINQGKFPALGEGGILYVNNPIYMEQIQAQYAVLKGYSNLQEIKLYATMLIKALMHTPWIYQVITLRLKKNRLAVACREMVNAKRMAKGVSRMYQLALPTIADEITLQQRNAQSLVDQLRENQWVKRMWYGDNAFMLMAETDEPEQLKNYFAQHSIETATHFAKAIEWAREFGYTPGECPMAEKLTKKLVMIPTYVPLAQV